MGLKIVSMSFLSVTSIVCLNACSDDATEKAASAVTSTVSCYNDTAKTCWEYLVAGTTGAGSDQQSCESTQGSYAASECKTEGKLKGCEFTASGIKTSRYWAYSSEAVAVLEATCNAAIQRNNSNASAQYVDP
jgi:hypothetical protein